MVNWEKYDRIAQEFFAAANKLSKEAAEKILHYQKQVALVLTRLNKGEISAVAAKRVTGRYRNGIKAEAEGMLEGMNWEYHDQFWSATNDIINFLGSLGSVFITVL